MFTRFEVLKTYYFPYTVHYFCSSMPRLSETRKFFTKLIVLRSETCSDWPAIRCAVIGRIPQALDGNVIPLTVLWCHVPARRHKNNKTRYKRGIWYIQRGHNYWLWWLIRSSMHYHVCICDRQALLYTAQNSWSNSQWQILQIRKRTYRLWVRSARLSLYSWNCPTL